MLPGKHEGMNSEKDVDTYMTWRKENLDLLQEFVSLGGEMEKTQDLMRKKGEMFVCTPHASTYEIYFHEVIFHISTGSFLYVGPTIIRSNFLLATLH